MALCLCTREQLAALPAETEYRLIADRPDLFAGRVAVELRGKEIPAGWALAPAKYPNGVALLDGCAAPWEKPAPVVDRLADVSDAEIAVAVTARKLDVALLGLDPYRTAGLTSYRVHGELCYGDPVVVGPDGYARIVRCLTADTMNALLGTLNKPLADAPTADSLCEAAERDAWAAMKAGLDASAEPVER